MTENNIENELRAALLAARRPIILSHARPDGDTVGTAAALCHVFTMLGQPAAWACPDPLPRRLAFLFEGLTRPTPANNEGGTVIAVDVASAIQLGKLIDVYRVDFTVDHHESGKPFTKSFTVPTAAATAEVLYPVICRLAEEGHITFTPALATALYAALCSDTGCFTYRTVGEGTRKIGDDLIRRGADAEDIFKRLYESRTETQLRAERLAARRFTARLSGRVGAVCLPLSDCAEFSEEDFETSVDVARSMLPRAEVSISIREIKKGMCKVSLRANGVDVAKVARSFGGGGHRYAAGCFITGEAEDALNVLLPSIETEMRR